jgi:hypothetical protein
MTLLYYRCVGVNEFQDIISTRTFRISSNSLEGKFFADTLEAARAWGNVLNPSAKFHIIKVELDERVSEILEVFPNLDGIGTAYYVSNDMLETFNRLILLVTEVSDEA